MKELYEVATRVRKFVEPKFPVRDNKIQSSGYCFLCSDVLAHALNQQFNTEEWFSGEGLYATQDVLEDINQGKFQYWSQIEDVSQFHAWVSNGLWLVDITADQFGLEPVIVMKAVEAHNWLPRYFSNIPLDDTPSIWIKEWDEKISNVENYKK